MVRGYDIRCTSQVALLNVNNTTNRSLVTFQKNAQTAYCCSFLFVLLQRWFASLKSVLGHLKFHACAWLSGLQYSLASLKSVLSLSPISTSPFQFLRLFVVVVVSNRYQHNHQNPVEVGTAYDIIPGSVASNASSWNCIGGDCPATAGSFDLTRFNVSYWQNYERYCLLLLL